MARSGGMYGPDATFLGVPTADLADPTSLAGADEAERVEEPRRRVLQGVERHAAPARQRLAEVRL
ncbi:MAG TPA: hypothetical protein VIV12_22360, partial [Streptosporangiaceae bacterium]